MKISYNWLQTYFKENLPSPEKVEEAFTFHAFEVEGLEKLGNDTIMDIKVLPDRAHYALSHKGIAYELSAILNLKVHEELNPELVISSNTEARISVDDLNVCPRYTARIIENIEVKDSPTWLKERLEAVGQRSINNIVDITNYVMLDKGQPLHAFDFDKIKGTLTLRYAQNSEKLTLLDGRDVILDESIFIEADDKGPLAIAGIKGGKNEGIDANTKNIILVAGNFDAVLVRKASVKLGIRSDASKRFENNLSPESALQGLEEATRQLVQQLPNSKIGKVSEVYPNPVKSKSFEVSIDDITEMIGLEIPKEDIVAILSRLEIKFEEKGNKLVLSIPVFRNDINNLNDVVEEVGRIYGYDKIKPSLPLKTSFKPGISKVFYYSEKIKDFLVEKGYSEVYTYSLVSKGEFEIEKSVALDKNFLRTNLTEGIVKSLDLNARNAELLGLDEINIFQIGNVFDRVGEYTSLAIGIKNTKKKQEKEKEKIKKLRDELLAYIGADFSILCTVDDTGGIISIKGKSIGKTNEVEGVMEINLDTLISSLPEVKEDVEYKKAVEIEYKKFSQFPYITRDIALFVSSDVNISDVQNTIRQNLDTSVGPLLVKGPDLFDQFEKDGKVSLAFRMIFQADDRTLTDDEVNGSMDKLYLAVKEKGWQVR